MDRAVFWIASSAIALMFFSIGVIKGKMDAMKDFSKKINQILEDARGTHEDHRD